MAGGSGTADARRPVGLFVGLATLDVILGVERLPGPDEKVVATSQLIAAGGPAANAAVAFGWVGGHPRLLTALGHDPMAVAAARDLTEHGVELTDADPDRTAPPPVAAILVTEATGARAVVSRTDRDAAAPSIGRRAAARLVDGAGIVVSDGHHPSLAAPILKAARGAGIPTLLDAGTWRPAFTRLLPLADLVVASAAFRPPRAGTGPTAVLDYLLAQGASFAAMTAGAGPIAWRSAAGGHGRIEVEPIDAVDTLGAGDILHGVLAALLVGLATPRAIPGPDPPDLFVANALAAAAGVATAACAHRGTRAWLTAPIHRPALR